MEGGEGPSERKTPPVHSGRPDPGHQTELTPLLLQDLDAFLSVELSGNVGFIATIHSRELNARVSYHFTNWFINLLLVSQAGISGTLVALAASEILSGMSVAILGAISVVITSILAILRVNGCPESTQSMQPVSEKFNERLKV